MTNKVSLSYKDAGVDIDAGDALIERIKAPVRRTLRPEVIGGLGGFLGSLLGGGGGYERYLAILTSRSMMEDVLDRFNLIEVYDIDATKGEREARFKATDQLRGNVDFVVELDYDYLAVVAFDKDPERAAEMANFMVEKLNEEHARLTSESARQTRQVIERRLNRATTDLDSVRSALQTFQETHGLVELEAILHARAAAALHIDAQHQRRIALVADQLGDLGGRRIGKQHRIVHSFTILPLMAAPAAISTAP